MMNKTEQKTDKRAASRAKPPVAPARNPAPDRPSHSGERAEGEGMLAPQTPQEKAPELEGEGSYTATRRYDEGLQRSVAKGDAERLGEEAARALDGPEGADLRKAAEAAKHGHKA
jgi:hypothetical protein